MSWAAFNVWRRNEQSCSHTNLLFARCSMILAWHLGIHRTLDMKRFEQTETKYKYMMYNLLICSWFATWGHYNLFLNSIVLSASRFKAVCSIVTKPLLSYMWNQLQLSNGHHVRSDVVGRDVVVHGVVDHDEEAESNKQRKQSMWVNWSQLTTWRFEVSNKWSNVCCEIITYSMMWWCKMLSL